MYLDSAKTFYSSSYGRNQPWKFGYVGSINTAPVVYSHLAAFGIHFATGTYSTGLACSGIYTINPLCLVDSTAL